jgi:enamine deaminase RidA (YjgF/YER057c/UK114 family)
MSVTEARLTELGLQLADPPAPAGNYVRTVTVGELLFTSGHGPKPDPERQFIGKVGTDIGEETARRAARQATLACLASLRHDLGDLDRIDHVVKLFGMVNSAHGFDRQPRVLDGASDLLVDLFGDQGRPARSAVGVAELPGGMCIEIDMVVALAPRKAAPDPKGVEATLRPTGRANLTCARCV